MRFLSGFGCRWLATHPTGARSHLAVLTLAALVGGGVGASPPAHLTRTDTHQVAAPGSPSGAPTRVVVYTKGTTADPNRVGTG